VDPTQDFLDALCTTQTIHSVFSSLPLLPPNCPHEEFATYVKWVLMNSLSGYKEDATSSTPNSEPSLTTPCWMKMMSEPTADRESAQGGATEPENTSDQMCESATSSANMGIIVEFEGVDEIPAHIPTPKSESWDCGFGNNGRG